MNQKSILILCFFLGFYITCYGYKLPDAYGLVNVTDFGAIADDGLDDTDAIQSAINYAKNLRLRPRDQNWADERHVFVVYVPNGVYDVSNTLYIETSTVEERSYRIILMGESTDSAIIRLKNNCTGFTNRATPKPVWRTINNPKSNKSQQYSIEDITFEIGSGNPGAIAVDHFNNNLGSVRNLRIVCKDMANKGAIGFKFDRNTGGICYIYNMEISGFDVGIKTKFHTINLVFENLNISDCNTGFYNQQKGIQIRNFVTHRVTRPVYQTDNVSNMIIINGDFNDGNPNNDAVVRSGGVMYLRETRSSGFKSVTNGISSHYVEEYTSGSRFSLWDTHDSGSLKLPVKNTPNPKREPIKDWLIVDCDAQGDDTEAIQSAIDSGAKTVFLVGKNTYDINSPIIIRGNIERLHGGWNKLWFGKLNVNNNAITVETGSSQNVIIECFSYIHGIRNQSSKDLVIRSSYLSHPNINYETVSENPGDVYIDEVAPRWNSGILQSFEGTTMIFRNQDVYIRDINTEGFTIPITCEATNLWLFGFKFGEKMVDPAILATDFSSVEVLGGLLNGPTAKGRSLFKTIDSEISIVGVFSKNGTTPETEGIFISETHDGVTRTLKTSALPSRLSGFNCPIYSGKRLGVTVDAGSDTTITDLPVESVLLSGSVTPLNGNYLYKWTQLEGEECLLNGTDSPTLEVLNPSEGEYKFRLIVYFENSDSAFDEVNLRVICKPCHTPEVNISADRIVILPKDTLQLSGFAKVQRGRIESYSWMQIAGNAIDMVGKDTTALILSNLSAGTYIFQFSAVSDQGYSDSKQVEIKVLPELWSVLTTNETITADGVMGNAWCGEKHLIEEPVIGFDYGDASASLLWDENYLHLFVTVDDDYLINDSGDEWWNDDAVEICIDANNSKGLTYEENDFRYGFRWHWDQSKMDFFEEIHQAVNGVLWNIQEFPGGYALEASFPWSTLNHTPVSGDTIGLQIRIFQDKDGWIADAVKSLFSYNGTNVPTPNKFGSVVLDENSCTPLTLSHKKTSPELIVYPGISSGRFFVTSDHINTSLGYSVFNISGLLISTGIVHTNGGIIDIENPDSGVYFVKFDNATSQIFKLIIK